MNERIKELAVKAGIYGLARLDGTFENEAEVKKFAELIVRECIDIVSPYAIRMENFDGGHPIDDLKKHFGVE